MGKSDSYINAQGVRISKATGKPVKKYTKRDTAYWNTRMNGPTVPESEPIEVVVDPVIAELQTLYTEEEIQGIIDLKKDSAPIELVEIHTKAKSTLDESNTGFLIASDWHADEVVKVSTVLGKNEYNRDIAEKRIKNFFSNAIYMVKKKPVDNLVVGLIGDMIGGYIHDELAQTNSMTPMQGVQFVKTLIISGLMAIHDELPDLQKIVVVGICGNHSNSKSVLLICDNKRQIGKIRFLLYERMSAYNKRIFLVFKARIGFSFLLCRHGAGKKHNRTVKSKLTDQ